jgi:ketosteroid isomerase-like protein
MSQENLEVVRDQYAATNERDFKRVMSHYAEDVELVVYFQDIRAGTFKGRDATGRWFGDWLSSFDREARFDLKELTELEDGSVLVVADHHARGRASGAEVHGTVVWLYRLREGKIIRVEGYPSRDDALEAAGLRQRDDHLGR